MSVGPAPSTFCVSRALGVGALKPNPAGCGGWKEGGSGAGRGREYPGGLPGSRGALPALEPAAPCLPQHCAHPGTFWLGGEPASLLEGGQLPCFGAGRDGRGPGGPCPAKWVEGGQGKRVAWGIPAWTEGPLPSWHRAALEEDAYSRIKLVLRWYLSGFYKKPKVRAPAGRAGPLLSLQPQQPCAHQSPIWVLRKGSMTPKMHHEKQVPGVP